MSEMLSEAFTTRSSKVKFGPYHEAFSGPLRVVLSLDGEIIVGCEIDPGYTHRGLEKAMELHPWKSQVTYADRLDPETAAFSELAVCMAAEEIGEWVVPERAQRVRILLSELTRISSHQGYMIRLARSVGSETMLHYLLRDRERVLDLFELLSGARYNLNFLCFGGISEDVTEGFLERMLEVCDVIRERIKEYNDLFTYNFANLKRMTYSGVVPLDWVRQHGVTGPNARASGLDFDVRRDHPYSGYERVDFTVPRGEGLYGVPGDCHDRLLVRLRELSQSLEIVRQIGDRIPPGEFRNGAAKDAVRLPAGEAYARVESSRGLLGCHLVSDGGDRPARVQFRVPSQGAFAILPRVLSGCRLEDMPMILSSLDLSAAEFDR